MFENVDGCLTPGGGADPVGELRRQAVCVDDLRQRLDDVVRALPRDDAFAGWWGAARDALQETVDLERARLVREVDRLEGVRIQLMAAADQAAAGGGASAALGGSP